LDLDGILAAQDLSVGAVFAFEERELFLATARAIGHPVQLNLPNISKPKIEDG
jgi:hypothetical protein